MKRALHRSQVSVDRAARIAATRHGVVGLAFLAFITLSLFGPLAAAALDMRAHRAAASFDLEVRAPAVD